MKKENKKTEEKQENIEEKASNLNSGYGIVILLVVLFIVFIAVVFLVNESKSFNLYGFKWDKIKVGELLFYYTKIHIMRADGQEVNYNLYLRNDPRKLETIKDEILFRKNITYISVDPNLSGCQYASVSIVSLSSFLSGTGIPTKGAINVKNYSENDYERIPYVDCETHPGNNVVLIRKANESQVIGKAGCYVIDVNNCEILKETERFMVSIVEQFSK